ncbi:hypothetical protein Dimus_013006, partial [Dionaea muscipula]
GHADMLRVTPVCHLSPRSGFHVSSSSSAPRNLSPPGIPQVKVAVYERGSLAVKAPLAVQPFTTRVGSVGRKSIALAARRCYRLCSSAARMIQVKATAPRVRNRSPGPPSHALCHCSQACWPRPTRLSVGLAGCAPRGCPQGSLVMSYAAARRACWLRLVRLSVRLADRALCGCPQGSLVAAWSCSRGSLASLPRGCPYAHHWPQGFNARVLPTGRTPFAGCEMEGWLLTLV